MLLSSELAHHNKNFTKLFREKLAKVCRLIKCAAGVIFENLSFSPKLGEQEVNQLIQALNIPREQFQIFHRFRTTRVMSHGLCYLARCGHNVALLQAALLLHTGMISRAEFYKAIDQFSNQSNVKSSQEQVTEESTKHGTDSTLHVIFENSSFRAVGEIVSSPLMILLSSLSLLLPELFSGFGTLTGAKLANIEFVWKNLPHLFASLIIAGFACKAFAQKWLRSLYTTDK